MRHTVEFKDFEIFYPKVRLCGSHSKKENKSIDMVIHPTSKKISYITTDKANNKVRSFTDLREAIQIYNKI